MNEIVIYIATYLSLCLICFNIILLFLDTKWHRLSKAEYSFNKFKLLLLTSILTFVMYVTIVIVLSKTNFIALASLPIKINISTFFALTLSILCIVTAIILFISFESHKVIRSLGNNYHLTLKLFSDIKRNQTEYPIFVSERDNSTNNIEVHADEIHCLTHLFGHIVASGVIHQNNVQIFHSSTPGAPDINKPIAYAVIGSPVNNHRSKVVNQSVQPHRSKWKLDYTFNDLSENSSECYLKPVYGDWDELKPKKHETEAGRWIDYAIIAKVPNINDFVDLSAILAKLLLTT